MTFNGAPNKFSETPPPSPDLSVASAERRGGCCGKSRSPRKELVHSRVCVWREGNKAQGEAGKGSVCGERGGGGGGGRENWYIAG